jgi:hypothetical protein
MVIVPGKDLSCRKKYLVLRKEIIMKRIDTNIRRKGNEPRERK